MLDYYGSVTFSKDEAKETLKNYLLEKKLSEEYSQKLILEIDLEIPQEMSVSGWWVFHSKTLRSKLDMLITRDLERAEARLKVATVLTKGSELKDEDVIQKVADSWSWSQRLNSEECDTIPIGLGIVLKDKETNLTNEKTHSLV